MRLSRWDEFGASDETAKVIKGLAHWHLAQVKGEDTSRDRLRDLIDRGDNLGLCTIDLPIAKTAGDHYHLQQVIGFFKKRRDLTLDGVDPEAVAKREFYRAESECWETNRLFSMRARGELTFSPRVEAVLYRARQKIASILGNVPSLDDLRIRFGPGATTDVPRRRASVRRKLHMPFSCSEDLFPRLNTVCEQFPSWTQLQGFQAGVSSADLVRSSKIRFVPKSAKTHRSIAIEPQLNILFQLGVGAEIASRLRREGVDIRDQTRNQVAAREGSLHGGLATLDLSSASDLVSYWVVLDLLPIDWVDLLNTFRSATVSVDGRTMRLGKFSTMGNGYTFPLETLIFYALSWGAQDIHCVGDNAVTVYGDDIIVPTRSVPLVTETLQAVGFRVNMTKSFWSGPFRESCGKDYFSGIDVRPFYLKDGLSGMSLFTLHNYYVRRGMPEPASLVLSEIPGHLRLWGPDGYGDGHLVGNWEPRPYRRKRGWAGYTFDTYSLCGLEETANFPSDCVLPSYSIYARPPKEGVADIPEAPLARVMREYGRRSFNHGDGQIGEDVHANSVTIPGWNGYTRKSIYVLNR